jgi:hypothetical protein
MERARRESEVAKRLTPEETATFFHRLIERAIKPHAQAIAEMWVEDSVAVVFFEATGGARAQAKEAFGWDGVSDVFAMPEENARRCAAGCKHMGDNVTHAWLMTNRPGRVFALVHDGATFLLNFGDDGWSLEPNSTDAGWMS